MDVKNLSPRQFFQDFYGCDNCTVTYRIFEYQPYVQSMTMTQAIEKLERDIKETLEFLQSYGLEIEEERVKEAVYSRWQKKLVKYSAE